VTAGWTASVWFDFSSSFDFVDPDFDDTVNGETDSNACRSIVPLIAPFEDGAAVLCGRKILELGSNGIAAIHDFTPSSPNAGDHPDRPRDLAFAAASTAGVAGRLLVAGGSVAGGDGVFQIDSGWTQTRLANTNNSFAVVYDVAGQIDNLMTPQIYYAAQSAVGDVLRYDGTNNGAQVIGSMGGLVRDLELAGNGGFNAVSINPDMGNLGVITSTGAGMHQYTSRKFGSSTLWLVGGATGRLSDGVYVIAGGVTLGVVHDDDSLQPLATTTTSNWVWRAAAVLPVAHSSGSQVRFLVLESNRLADLDRVLLIGPP
jgi:hypothetical protein